MKKINYKQRYLLLVRVLQCIGATIGIAAIELLALVKTGIVIM